MTTRLKITTPVHIIVDRSEEAAVARRRLREAVLPTREARSLDYAVLNGRALDVKDLEVELRTCPAVGPRRLVVIEDGHRMSDACWTLIRHWAERDDLMCVVLVEMKNTRGTDRILRSLQGKVSVLGRAKTQAANPFDLTRMMQVGQKEQALRLLHRLLEENQAPLQIMGVLGWFWGKTSVRFGSRVRDRGWKVLLKADEAIKRSRMTPTTALEYTVLSLVECMNPRRNQTLSSGRRLRR